LAIRRLVDSDVERYHALRVRGLAEHPEAFSSSAEEEARTGLAKLRARIVPNAAAPHDVVLGAFEGGALVGVIGMIVDPRAKVRHRGHVVGTYVAGECARRGIGRMLLDALIEHAERCGELDALVLTVTAGNAAAYRLYERTGFVTFGREPGAVRIAGRSYDKLHMIRTLAADAAAAE